MIAVGETLVVVTADGNVWLAMARPAPVGIGRPASATGPSVTSAGGKLLLAWRGIPDDDGLYYTQGTSTPGMQPDLDWSTQAVIEGTGSSSSPAIAALNSRVYLAWKGIQDDHTIWMTFM